MNDIIHKKNPLHCPKESGREKLLHDVYVILIINYSLKWVINFIKILDMLVN